MNKDRKYWVPALAKIYEHVGMYRHFHKLNNSHDVDCKRKGVL